MLVYQLVAIFITLAVFRPVNIGMECEHSAFLPLCLRGFTIKKGSNKSLKVDVFKAGKITKINLVTQNGSCRHGLFRKIVLLSAHQEPNVQFPNMLMFRVNTSVVSRFGAGTGTVLFLSKNASCPLCGCGQT